MIVKCFKERIHDEFLERMSNKQKDSYNKIINDINAKKEKYIVAVDLAHPFSKDYSVIIKYQQDNEGNLIVYGIGKFR